MLICLTERPVAERSMLIKNMMDDLGEDALSTEVPIPNVSPPFPVSPFKIVRS